MGICLSNANQMVSPIARRLTRLPSQLQALPITINESHDNNSIIGKLNEDSAIVEGFEQTNVNAPTDQEESKGVTGNNKKPETLDQEECIKQKPKIDAVTIVAKRDVIVTKKKAKKENIAGSNTATSSSILKAGNAVDIKTNTQTDAVLNKSTAVVITMPTTVSSPGKRLSGTKAVQNIQLAVPSSDSKTPFAPILFISFENFRNKRMMPRYPDDSSLAVPLESINRENSFLVFVSHCWLRGHSNAAGWEGRPHPDNINHEKYNLVVEVVEKAWKSMASAMDQCHLWVDYGCINQDKDPAGELKQLDKIVGHCDCILTPIVDHTKWELELTHEGYFVDYKAPGWNVGPYSYINRGWCRIEMFFAAHIPVISSDNRLQKFSAGLRTALSIGRRIHLLYGTRESVGRFGPIVLPPLLHSYFEKYHPLEGNLTVQSDRNKIQQLVQQLEPYMTKTKYGYEGDRNAAGEMHGKGRFSYSNGDVYEGMFLHNERHGQGKLYFCTGSVYEGYFHHDAMNTHGTFEYANGDVYVGENKRSLKDGYGKYTYANGDIYEGTYRNDKKDGAGKYTYASGNVYEGHFLNNMKHGDGRFTYSNGDVYEGGWARDIRNGRGRLRYANGDVCEGIWSDGKMSGTGMMISVASGDVYDGHFLNDKMHGKGRLRYGNGDVYDGDWMGGYQHGFGKFCYASGNVYDGHFENGLRHGQGVFNFANGDVYTGQFLNNEQSGFGVLKYSSGNVYEGQFQNNEKHGEGKFLFSDGHCYEGEWKHDKMNGIGKYVFASGDVYEGEFLNGNMHGHGVLLYKKSGNIFEGQFQNDVRHGHGVLTFGNGNKAEGEWVDGKRVST